jgi:signal peptidase I
MPSSGIAKTASIIAYLMAGSIFLLSFWTGLMFVIPLAIIVLIGARGIQRQRVWSAYGLAVFYVGQLVVAGIAVARSQNVAHDLGQCVFAALLSAGLAVLFSRAGRDLSKEGSAWGSRIPWLVLTGLMVLGFLFFQPFAIPSGAMEDTILIGDKILVRRLPIGKLERGDLVTFVYPPDRRQSFVKRICGVPGDRIRISQKVLYVNDSALREPYAVRRTGYTDAYRDNFPSDPTVQLFPGALRMLSENVVNGELVVPAGKYFVLGDNRDFSLDSRYWGFIDAADIFGRPVLIYDSRSQTPDAISKNRFSSWNSVRWNRLFRRL